MKWFSLLLLLAMTVGCAHRPTYQATVANRTDGAVVRGWKSSGFMFFTYTEIEQVDGLRLSVGSQLGGRWLVDPGLRVLSVAGTYAGGFLGVERYTGRAEFEAPLKAGHTYLIKAERSGEIMTLWIEDQATHEVVTAKRSTETTHWIKWL